MSAGPKVRAYALKRLEAKHSISPMAAMMQPCPPAGEGVHQWLLAAANSCRIHGFTKEKTELWLDVASSGCGRDVPEREIDDAVRTAWTSQVGWKKQCRPVSKPVYQKKTLEALAAQLPEVDEDWLRVRSPIDPASVGPREFLEAIFLRGEIAAIFTETTGPATLWRCGDSRHGHLTWSTLPKLFQDVFFLSNPVDGKSHRNQRSGKMSNRSQESVTSFRYAVIESDLAPANLWLPAIAQLDLPIAALYTSGGKSIHALWRIDASNKEDWDAKVAPLRPKLIQLGADPAALTAVRLTRLPGCLRGSKGKLQKLLYLNPDPSVSPLTKMPVIR